MGKIQERRRRYTFRMDQGYCSELPVGSVNGVYKIYPGYGLEVNVYCEMESDCHGWTVVQRRLDGSTDFNVEWVNYKAGFGELNREYWIGNDNLHVISSSKDYLLRFDLEDFNGDTTYAKYSTFRIGNEAFNYILTIGGYSGTADFLIDNIFPDVSHVSQMTTDRFQLS
ncbi:fibroleukin-like [Mytilus californianus]|uniref:fibroleukin-like n=1 Tax=Mytilus californianus TaxID=6549 RepID=UPI002245D473|nr:fibroleukin-like [Mytilus californianus]